MITNLTDDTLKDFIANNTNAVIIFSAPWCQPCKILTPVLSSLSEINHSVAFGKVNIEECDRATTEYSIRSVPTVLYLKNGNLLDSSIGNIPKHKIQEKIASFSL
jgi:thioredoxin 1